MIDVKHPDDPVTFIKNCILKKQLFWTYHVNMRMKDRFISREMIQLSVNNFEIIESYPEDKYLPSYLVYSSYNEFIFHILIAVDYKSENIRIVTAYYPDPAKWDSELKRRKII